MVETVEILSVDGLKVAVGRPGRTIEITVQAASSENAVRGAAAIANDNMVTGVTWTSASITGIRMKTLEIEGQKNGQVVVILVQGGVSAGFKGAGTSTSAEILSRFGFGPKEELTEKLAKPTRFKPPAWFVHP